MKKALLPLLILLAGFFIVGCFGLKTVKLSGSDKVALVEVKGVIIEPDDIVEDLEKARKDKKIKAVVLRVDSPGGSVGASEEIYRTIKNLDKEKPVIASMGDVAASGGYLVSAAARKIYANEGTVTGSIGVRLELVNAKELYQFIKLQPETIKSGKFKDIGSTTRPLTPEERELLQSFISELHEQFKGFVSESRGIDREDLDKIADGRIFSGLTAKGLNLIDEIGGQIDAVKEAASISGIEGDPNIVKMKKKDPWWYELLIEDARSILGQVKTGLLGYRYFLYEWRPK